MYRWTDGQLINKASYRSALGQIKTQHQFEFHELREREKKKEREKENKAKQANDASSSCSSMG